MGFCILRERRPWFGQIVFSRISTPLGMVNLELSTPLGGMTLSVGVVATAPALFTYPLGTV